MRLFFLLKILRPLEIVTVTIGSPHLQTIIPEPLTVQILLSCIRVFPMLNNEMDKLIFAFTHEVI